MTRTLRQLILVTLFAFAAHSGLALAEAGAQAEAGAPRVHVVSFGLFGAQDLFRREANAAALALSSHFNNSGLVVVRTNDAVHSDADAEELAATLDDVGAVIDRDNDVVVIVLTSHGNRRGLAVVKRGIRRGWILSPADLDGMLAQSGIRKRVVILSACYSGVFAERLANEDTLVITAADSYHPSFGCSDDNTGNYTWFGEAFFQDSLKPGVDIATVFAHARRRVAVREAVQHLIHSNPEMRGGAAVLAMLARAR